jgi:hypothetical protein
VSTSPASFAHAWWGLSERAFLQKDVLFHSLTHLLSAHLLSALLSSLLLCAHLRTPGTRGCSRTHTVVIDITHTMADSLAPHFLAKDDSLRVLHDGTGDVAGSDIVALAEDVAAAVRDKGFAVVRSLLTKAEVCFCERFEWSLMTACQELG